MGFNEEGNQTLLLSNNNHLHTLNKGLSNPSTTLTDPDPVTVTGTDPVTDPNTDSDPSPTFDELF